MHVLGSVTKSQSGWSLDHSNSPDPDPESECGALTESGWRASSACLVLELLRLQAGKSQAF